MPSGWFARTKIPAYSLSLTVHLTEEERFLLKHSGIGHYVFFRAPTPPDIINPEAIKRLKAENFGLYFVRDLFGFGQKTLIGAWPDVIAADDAETAIRLKLEEIAGQLNRAGDPPVLQLRSFNPISPSCLVSCPGAKSHANITTSNPPIARTRSTSPSTRLRTYALPSLLRHMDAGSTNATNVDDCIFSR